ncbi:MAG TPA: CPBP family intramembrane glutamic endopeptidase [Thermoanaerobaculia bacterium]|nr:CPBP family intramembrane glutamic endopeptidase [Thermoanaerobaculia bacterium]
MAGRKRVAVVLAVFFLLWWLVVWLRVQPRALFVLVKALVWIGGPAVYLRFVDGRDPLEFLQLKTHPRSGLVWSMVVLVVIGPLWVLAVVLLRWKSLDLSRWTPSNLVGALLVAALIEEIAMRGFVLGKLREVARFWTANLLTGLFFVAIHWQAWLFSGAIARGRIPAMSLSILALSLAAGYLVRKSGSVWPAVALHGVQNLVALL